MKKVIITIVILFGLLCFRQTFAQENPREARPVGLSLYGGGPPLIASVTIDYFVSSTVSLELGGGAFGVYTGGRYHFKGDIDGKRWTPYTGLLYARYGQTVGVDQLFFLPLGMQFVGEQGFNFAIEFLILGDSGPYVVPVWPGIKFGYRF